MPTLTLDETIMTGWQGGSCPSKLRNKIIYLSSVSAGSSEEEEERMDFGKTSSVAWNLEEKVSQLGCFEKTSFPVYTFFFQLESSHRNFLPLYFLGFLLFWGWLWKWCFSLPKAQIVRRSNQCFSSTLNHLQRLLSFSSDAEESSFSTACGFRMTDIQTVLLNS